MNDVGVLIISMVMALVGWVVLMLVGTNLVGFVVRGLFPKWANTGANILGAVLGLFFLYLLFHFWNIGVVIAAVMLMAARIPDLLWEIRHVSETDMGNRALVTALLPKGGLNMLTTLMDWAALPVLWWALYSFYN